MKLKESFKSLDADGNELDLAIQRPTPKQLNEAQVVFAETFKKMLPKALLRQELDQHLRERGMWNDKKEEEYQRLTKAIVDGERRLDKGGFALSEAREVALQMARDRLALRDLIADRNALDSMTVEGMSDDKKFNYLVSVCTVYNSDGKPYYKSFEDFQEKSSEPTAILAATILMTMLYNVDADFEGKLPENKWLRRFGFADEQNRLINKDKKLIDLEGRLIDENGRYINEQNEFVDINGVRVTEDGSIDEPSLPFLDTEGNPIVESCE